VQERDEKKPGGEWERVCRQCDFNPKGSRNTKDVSRMRSILLQLKQTPIERQWAIITGRLVQLVNFPSQQSLIVFGVN